METKANYISEKWELSYPYFDYGEDFQDNSTPWSGHTLFGYNLVKNLRPEVVVELGTWRGSSFYSFCQAVKDNLIDCKLIAVDTWEGDKHAGYYGDKIFNEFIKILHTHYGDKFASYLREYFSDAVNKFADRSIDLLHIDGLHTYEAVKSDFLTWLPKVKSDGVILFHDIAVRKDDFGVWKLWQEIQEQYPYTLDFSHSNGLGILFLDKPKYFLVSEDFLNTKLRCVEYAYQSTKAELFLANYAVRELNDIKNSRFWSIKEAVKKVVFAFR